MTEKNAEAFIEGDTIKIHLPISALQMAVEGSWATGGLYARFKVTNPDVFAKEMVTALNREDEGGSTPIHRMFDQCFEAAIEGGADGIEEHEDQEA